MPFGLKKAGATFQRMVNKVLQGPYREHHVGVREWYVGEKCATHKSPPTSRQSLRFLQTIRGEAQFWEVYTRSSLREVLRISGHPTEHRGRFWPKISNFVLEVTHLYVLAALNQFISRSTDKCNPFFMALKKNGVDFRWNEKCETASRRWGYTWSHPFYY